MTVDGNRQRAPHPLVDAFANAALGVSAAAFVLLVAAIALAPLGWAAARAWGWALG